MFASILRERLHEMSLMKGSKTLIEVQGSAKKQGLLSESFGSSPNLEFRKKGSVSLRWMTALMP